MFDSYCVLDTETTGRDLEKDTPVEVAVVRVEHGKIVDQFESLVNPEQPISFGAMGTHHITEAMVAGAPRLATLTPQIHKILGDLPVTAHFAAFDKAMLRTCGITNLWLDNLRLSNKMWPDAPDHKNQTLRYYLGVDINRDSYHRALSDALVTQAVFQRTLLEMSDKKMPACQDVKSLAAFIDEPLLMHLLKFGNKHYDMPIEQVPRDYIHWMYDKVKDMDPDLDYSIRMLHPLFENKRPVPSAQAHAPVVDPMNDPFA